MEYREVRELVRIRHELRTLEPRVGREAAASLLDRMQSLAARDAVERAAVETEVQRWQFVFQLGS